MRVGHTVNDGAATPFVSTGAARALLAYLPRQGHAREKVLERAGIETRLPSEGERLPREANQRLWKVAVELADREALGLEVAMVADRGAFGLVEYLTRTTGTLADCLALLESYGRLTHDAVRFTSGAREDALIFTHGTRDGVAQQPEAVDFVAAVLVGVARQLAGLDFGLRAIALARPTPRDPTTWRRFFRCPVQFAAIETQLTIDAALAARPLPARDPALHELLRKQAQRELDALPSGPGDLTARVAEAIEESLLMDGGQLESVARRLGMSSRTLRRHLADAGIPFRVLRDGVRRRRALRLEGSARQSEIAAEVGFDSLSAYRRAFTRWTGMSPSAWRRRQRSRS